MLVNYKGRPWMKGATENPGLLYSLAAAVAGVIVAAWEVVPALNGYLGLVALPSDAARYQLLSILSATLLGSLAWDRLCVAIFAPRIFAAQVAELASLRPSDFVSEKTPQRAGTLALAAAWLYFTEGNLVFLGVAYFLYNKMYPKGLQPPAQQPPPAGAAQPQRVD